MGGACVYHCADPFVDDTCVFAGRVREAKRARKQELDTLLAGKSARFGETLRMSAAEPASEELRRLRRERDQLAGEEEDDWVRMVIYEDWSHGYLQMATLMPEARAVITDIAEWMDETFGAADGGTATTLAGAHRENGGPGRRLLSPRRAEGYRTHELSPLASETEVTETEGEGSGSPIVFTARRLRTPRASFSHDRRGRAPNRRSRSRHSGSDDATVRRSPRSDDTLLDGEVTRADEGGAKENTASGVTLVEALASRLGTPAVLTPTGAAASPVMGGKAGNTLTETEVMQRRRLLDAHLLQ